MDTCLHGDNLGSLTGGQSRDMDLTVCVCRECKLAFVNGCHLHVCAHVCVYLFINSPAYTNESVNFRQVCISLLPQWAAFCVCVCLFTSFWWWTSYSVLCLSSVSIRSSGIASIFIPVTGEGRKSIIYYGWWHSAAFSFSLSHSHTHTEIKLACSSRTDRLLDVTAVWIESSTYMAQHVQHSMHRACSCIANLLRTTAGALMEVKWSTLCANYGWETAGKYCFDFTSSLYFKIILWCILRGALT